MQQTPSQVILVVSLKHILVRQEAEEDNGFFQSEVNLIIRFLSLLVSCVIQQVAATYVLGSLFEIVVEEE